MLTYDVAREWGSTGTSIVIVQSLVLVAEEGQHHHDILGVEAVGRGSINPPLQSLEQGRGDRVVTEIVAGCRKNIFSPSDNRCSRYCCFRKASSVSSFVQWRSAN
ncbi:Hypothetical predicted protein [Olea europaea subsp. europaea]|uniref:Uncharacterized protein n=1 Tax=Olea europaea subsp. europaea TaxID=158383 RepID=A0A8S0SYX7_OLEEU|nr:Hypothetical predicted protein [Olea europaea subsp. europaea]